MKLIGECVRCSMLSKGIAAQLRAIILAKAKQSASFNRLPKAEQDRKINAAMKRADVQIELMRLSYGEFAKAAGAIVTNTKKAADKIMRRGIALLILVSKEMRLEELETWLIEAGEGRFHERFGLDVYLSGNLTEGTQLHTSRLGVVYVGENGAPNRPRRVLCLPRNRLTEPLLVTVASFCRDECRSYHDHHESPEPLLRAL